MGDVPATMGVRFEQAHELETDQHEETRERVRSALYETLLSLDPKQVREMLGYHLRRCTSPTCPTCCRVRERAAQRRQQRQKSEKHMRLWRGVAKSIRTMQLATVSRALSLFSLRGTNNLLTVFYQSIGP